MYGYVDNHFKKQTTAGIFTDMVYNKHTNGDNVDFTWYKLAIKVSYIIIYIIYMYICIYTHLHQTI